MTRTSNLESWINVAKLGVPQANWPRFRTSKAFVGVL